MSILETLDRDIKYSMSGINSTIKRKIFEEAYGNRIPYSTIEHYITGDGSNTPLCLYYSNLSSGWYCSTVDVRDYYVSLRDFPLSKSFKHNNKTILVV